MEGPMPKSHLLPIWLMAWERWRRRDCPKPSRFLKESPCLMHAMLNLAPRGLNLINSPGIAADMMMNHEMNNHLNILVLIIFLLWLTIVREMFHMLLMQCWVIWLMLLLLIQASMILSCTTSVFKWDSRPYHSIERNNSL